MSFPRPEKFYSPDSPRRVRKGQHPGGEMTPDQERRLAKLTGTVEKVASVVQALVERRKRAEAMLAAAKAEVNFICAVCERTFSEQEAEQHGGECPDCDSWLVKTPPREARPGELGHDDEPRPRGRQDQTLADEDRPRNFKRPEDEDDGDIDNDGIDDELEEDQFTPEEAERRGISLPARFTKPTRRTGGGRLDGRRLEKRAKPRKDGPIFGPRRWRK